MKNNKYVYEDKNGDMHRNYKPIAAMSICNTLSLYVIGINDEKITTIFSNGTGAKIKSYQYHLNNEVDFKKYGQEYNLDDFIKL